MMFINVNVQKSHGMMYLKCALRSNTSQRALEFYADSILADPARFPFISMRCDFIMCKYYCVEH